MAFVEALRPFRVLLAPVVNPDGRGFSLVDCLLRFVVDVDFGSVGRCYPAFSRTYLPANAPELCVVARAQCESRSAQTSCHYDVRVIPTGPIPAPGEPYRNPTCQRQCALRAPRRARLDRDAVNDHQQADERQQRVPALVVIEERSHRRPGPISGPKLNPLEPS